MSIIQGTSKSSAATYEIEQSIRFNDGDSPKLTGSTGQTGDGTQWTISMWVKRGAIDGNNHTIWSAGDGSNKRALSRFVSGGSGQASEDISFSVRTGGSWYELNVDQSFRDPSAWYHFVWVWDSDNGTAADRMRIYVNGERLTSFSNTPSYPASGTATDSWNNSTYAHQIGFENNTRFFDGYLAEMYHIDGQALTPDSFGETNSNTGQWVPKDASGLTFGTRGFYLKGEDSSDLGNDSSGNGNDLTSSGLAAADQVTDSPTNNFCTLNAVDKATQVTLADGNLQYGLSSNSYTAVRGTFGVSSGKWYWEMNAVSGMGLNTAYMGIATNASNLQTSSPPSDGTAYTYISYTGNKAYTSSTAYGDTWNTNGRVIGVALDLDAGKIWWSRDGVFQASGDPAAGTNEAFSGITGTWHPYIVFNDTSPNFLFNFGQSSFTYTPPTGFNALSTANLPDPTIADPSAYFQTTIYTGDGSSSHEINQTGNSTFEPSMVWIKSRSAATDHIIQDQVRGNFIIYPNKTDAEGATGGGWVKSFDSDGFTTDVNGPINASGATFAAWQWKAAGSGSSNTDGSITSTVSADTTSGFSIATYTGTGSAATVGHGLGVAPSMIIAKNRSTTSNWSGYHVDLGATKTINLNETAAAQTSSGNWNNTEPTSSVFSVNTATGTNGSGNSIIAYCFAEVEGFSKFGSYTGNGSTDGPFIYTGFMPEFIIVKSSSNAGTNWDMLDATREPFNDRGNQFEANTSDAEASNDHNCDFLSNGFKWRDGSGSNNGSGYTIIYMAFARSPFKTSNAQ